MTTRSLALVPLLLATACSPETAADLSETGALASRAYVVSEESNELFVFDYETLEAIGSVDTSIGGETNANHMSIVSPDASKVFVSASHHDALVVVDAASLEVVNTIDVGTHNTHMMVRDGTDELWVMNEDDNSISVVDMEAETVLRTIADPSFVVPHFVHFSGDFAYVPSIGGNQVSVIDLRTDEVVDTLVASGTEEGACAADPCGFADAQISQSGVLYASHIETGTVLVYDTIAHERRADLEVGGSPWSAFVDPFNSGANAAFVPSWADATVSRISEAGERTVTAVGDAEVYGVNYSPTAPDTAFVLNRLKEQIAVIDHDSGALLEELDVGGTTETGTTTDSGMLLVPLSSAGSVIVIDTATLEELARFEGIGTYPWSVATASGQGYCH